jgi:lysophospholipase L1-like esterase
MESAAFNEQALHVEALRGAGWEGDVQVPYPRADPADASRLPGDTWATALLPVGVRLELVGDATSVEIDYVCATGDLGYRGVGAGTAFTAWRGGLQVSKAEASIDGGTVELELGDGIAPRDAAEVITVYLPEGMRPTIFEVRPIAGSLAAAPQGPRWIAYGDSITEGWVASGPAFNWTAIAARQYGLDLVNLGYAGSARGEIASAEQIAALPADVISLAYGTNCWTRTPHSRTLFRTGLHAFLEIIRQTHPTIPIVVASPIIRPDAESTPNRLGATLADLRDEVEDLITVLHNAGASNLHLVRGLPLLSGHQLPDGVHPGDDGHRILAEAIGGTVAAVTKGNGAATVSGTS